jgi:hypothetical protein
VEHHDVLFDNHGSWAHVSDAFAKVARDDTRVSAEWADLTAMFRFVASGLLLTAALAASG